MKNINLGVDTRKYAACCVGVALLWATWAPIVFAQSHTLSLPLENKWGPARPLPEGAAAVARSAELPPSPLPSSLERLTIGAGDQIFITVFGQPDMSAEVTVNDNLQVTLPLIGTLKVGGLTPPTIEKLIAQRLKEGEYLLKPEVSIQVRQVRSQMMSVLGEVQRPGRFVITGKMMVLDALAMAGGLTPRADPTVVLIRRNSLQSGEGERQELTFSLSQLLDSSMGVLDLELKNDDVLFVALQKSFYIFGEVRKPGEYPMEPELNVMRALSISGGVTERGSMRKIRIHRKNLNQKIQELTPDLTHSIVGGDVIFVDERLF